MLPVIMAVLSMAKQKADTKNAQLAKNLQNQNVAGQPQQPTLQLPQQPQQNNVNRLQQVMSLMGK